MKIRSTEINVSSLCIGCLRRGSRSCALMDDRAWSRLSRWVKESPSSRRREGFQRQGEETSIGLDESGRMWNISSADDFDEIRRSTDPINFRNGIELWVVEKDSQVVCQINSPAGTCFTYRTAGHVLDQQDRLQSPDGLVR